jgi:hypothetical protein
MSPILPRPTLKRKSLPAIAAFAIALAGTTVSAQALEGKALFEKLFKDGTKISYSQISESAGGSFSATGVKIEYAGDDRVSTIQGLDVKALRETGDGRLAFDSISATELTGKARGNGGPFTIEGLSLTDSEIPYKIWQDGLTAEEKKQRIKIGALALTGFSAQQKRGDTFNVGSMNLQNADVPLDWQYDPASGANASTASAPMTFDLFAMAELSGSTSQGVSWDVANITIDGANIPTSIGASVDQWMKVYRSVSVGKITAALGDVQVFSMDSMTGTIGKPDGEGTIPSNSEIKNINVNLKALPDPQAKAIAQQLGYETVQIDMVGDGTYNPSSGALGIQNFAMNFKDMADLNLTYNMTGYTKDVANALQQAQVKIAGGANPQTSYAELLPILSNLKLTDFKFGLTDKSLTGRLLDFQAKQMGTTGDQLAQGAPMMIGLGMGGLNMPEFTEMVTKAVGSFLTNKGTLTVEAAPAEPVSIINVVLAGQADPTKVPEMLNLQISGK